MKEIIIPFTLFLLVLLTGLAGFFFVSPAGQVSALQAENNLLKAQLAEVRGNATENIVALVVGGMLLVTLACLGFFLMVLCLLSGKTLPEFFLPSFPAVPVAPAISQSDPESIPDGRSYTVYYADDSYAMQTLEVIQ
jgi:fatty acid desaturase